MAIQKSTNVREEVEIIRQGHAVTVPEHMSLDTAIETLMKRKKEEEQVVAFREVIDAFPPDGAVAFQRAIAKKYGWANMVPKPGFFGSNPPTFLSVQVSPTETIKVPWGRVEVPGISGYIETGVDGDTPSRSRFMLVGQTKGKDLKQVTELADLTREIVAAQSIYKGRALRVDFDGSKDVFENLRFLDLSDTKPEELVLPASIEADVKACVFTPILNANHCTGAGVQAKRGVLLLGPYGCGKTLIGRVAAKFCSEVERTFILLDDSRDLAKAVELAVRYAPAVIFAEDLDRAVGPDRDAEVDAILNTIDGIAHKHQEIMVVLTTNHVEQINKAMLRPGRMDAVITVLPPDPEAVTRLLVQYGRGLLSVSKEAMLTVGKKLAGQIPAVIREVVERAKLYAISQGRVNGKLTVHADDLDAAAESVLRQVNLIAGAQPATRPLLETVLGDVIAEAIGNRLTAATTHVGEATDEMVKQADRVRRIAKDTKESIDEAAENTNDRLRAIKDDTEEILSNQ